LTQIPLTVNEIDTKELNLIGTRFVLEIILNGNNNANAGKVGLPEVHDNTGPIWSMRQNLNPCKNIHKCKYLKLIAFFLNKTKSNQSWVHLQNKQKQIKL
jgi:hypothetical protein